MSVKRNLIIAAAAAFGVSAAYAGGPDMMAAPAASGFTPNFYAELGLGYADTQYDQFQINSATSSPITTTNTTNPNGGLSYGGDFGYQFMPHLAVELGGGYLPEYKFDGGSYGGTTGNSVSSWYAYGAGRIDTMIKDKINVFAKAGVSYRGGSFTVAGTDYDDYYWGPIFGAGVSYDVRDNIYVSAEYNHLGGSSDTADQNITAPDVNIYMGKVGYKFNV
jgi:hypothetical protein